MGTSLGTLTPTELSVAQALISGAEAKAIGRLFGISHRTVEAQRSHMMLKLGARTGPQLGFLLEHLGIKPILSEDTDLFRSGTLPSFRDGER